MSAFDPYHKWLGIRPEDQPPHHYRLLGISAFESDADVVDTAAEQRTTYLRTCATGEYVAHSQRLLNEVAAARLCLLNPQKKAAYDAELKAKLAPPPVEATPQPATPASTKAPPAVASLPTKAPAKTAALTNPTPAPDSLDGFDAADELGAALSALPRAPAVGRTKHGGSDKGGAAGRSGATGRRKSRGNGPPRGLLVGGGIGLLAVVGLIGGLFAVGGFGRGKPSSGKKPSAGGQTVVETPDGEKRKQPPDSTRPPSGGERPASGTTGPSGTPGSDVSAGSWAMPLSPRGPQPPIAVAPFDANQALAHQQAWSRHLARPMETTNSIGMRLRLIPPGRFTMGSPSGAFGAKPEEQPAREVTITKPLYFGTCEVTQEEFTKTMGRPAPGTDPSHLKRPALGMQRSGAVEFCQKLSQLPAEVAAGRTYRLPTEAEWEHACRAGTTTFYPFGDDAGRLGDYEWFAGNSHNTVRDVGVKRPNPWGLFDLCGNVGEWCADRFAANAYLRLPTVDPLFDDPGAGGGYSIRGGHVFSAPAERCRPAARFGHDPSWSSIGFRVVCEFGAPPVDLAARPTSGPTTTGPTTAGAAPPPAVAPFDAATAKAHQEAWAKHLGEPVETTNSLGMKFVVIPPGKFRMGEGGGAVPVELTRPFRLGLHEVTQRQFRDVTGAEPWKGQPNVREGADHAASYVSWDEATAFCRKLTERERTTGKLPADEEYRLPTDAEWEHACRAGTATAFSFGDDVARLGEFAWFDANTKDAGESYAHPVGLKKPNPWGLHDMPGNVAEWCSDFYGANLPGGTDPQGATSAPNRADRGGRWSGTGWNCRSSHRYGFPPGTRSDGLGFRVARTVAVRAKPPVGVVLPSAGVAPPIAVAPFDAAQAKAHQATWAKHLGEPVETVNSLGMRFVVIPPGEFPMGDGAKSVPRTVAKPFRLGIHEVTQSQWQRVMGTEPWKGRADVPEGADLPAVFVGWSDAAEFCRRLTELDRANGRLKAPSVYRLPSEVEWEYGCRAGTVTKHHFGTDATRFRDHAWYFANSERSAHPVGRLQPNAFGLHDTLGNVWEWTSDAFDGHRKVVRGGCWNDRDWRLTSRDGHRLDSPGDACLGFRVVREIDKEPAADESVANPAAVPTAVGAMPQWIWHGTTKTDCVLRKEFPGGSRSALLLATADDAMSISVDGRPVAESRDWKSPFPIDLQRHLAADRPMHVLQVVARNSHDDAGFVARLILTMDDGRRVEIVSDATWESAATPDAKTWTPARVIAPLTGGRWNDDPTVRAFGERVARLLLAPPLPARTP